MPVRAVVGLQWGDEGKGKIVDFLAENADVVVRCQGGANAGHTVVIGRDVFKLHLIPSGILREDIVCVIGNGVVLDPCAACAEIDGLAGRGIMIGKRLLISDRSHLNLPYHKVLDGLQEQTLGQRSIGTTRQGIGPCYADKANRSGLRCHHLLDLARFRHLLQERTVAANLLITQLGGRPLDPKEVIDEVMPCAERLRPLVANTVHYLHKALDEDKSLLLEGAQGSLLDIDFGTYPYLTSSNTTVGGCCTGSGIPPMRLQEVHGVMKAFTTRVGAGPFPTEVDGELLARLRGSGENQWDEFGTTTRRPRRCGWLDLVVAKYAARINGVTHLHITKLDILSQFSEIKICASYRLDGTVLEDYPASLEVLSRCEPEYESLPGWCQALGECRSFADLPSAARQYVKRISEIIGASIASIGFGPGREQTIRCG